MHTRRKGTSRSKKPLRKTPPQWTGLTIDEIEKKVVELAKQGKSTSRIGTELRDMYGVPDIKLSTGKKVVQILASNNAAPSLPEDIYNLISRALRLRKHLAENHKDNHNMRALNNIESKIHRLSKYYRNSRVLPADWKYSPQTAERLINW